MTPEVRAAADRLILDSANLKYLAAVAPREALDRQVPGFDGSVRQMFGHVAARLDESGGVAEAFLDGRPVAADSHGESIAIGPADRPLPDILGQLDLAVARILRLCEQIPEPALGQQIDGRPFVETLREWTSHCSEHAIDIVAAVPEVRLDPMILNWVLYIDYRADPMREERQQELLAWVREHLDELPDEEDDWEENEE